jgi:hypothetical protein
MIETENTQKAISSLRKVTTNEILFLSKAQFEEKFKTKLSGNGAHYYLDDKHYICIDNTRSHSEQECTYVHECLHAILRIEGYPCCYLEGIREFRDEEKKSLMNISGRITDALHHPEIYQRMTNDYNLNMGIYFENLLTTKIDRLEKVKREGLDNISIVYMNQQNFIDAIEYFFYPKEVKFKIFQKIKEILPDNYSFLKGIKPKKLRFETPENSKSTINDFLKRIKKYGQKRNAEMLNEAVWNLMLIK